MSGYGNAVWNEPEACEPVRADGALAQAIQHVQDNAEKVAAMVADLEARLGYVTQQQEEKPSVDVESALASLPGDRPKSAARDDLDRVARRLKQIQSRIGSLCDRIEL